MWRSCDCSLQEVCKGLFPTGPPYEVLCWIKFFSPLLHLFTIGMERVQFPFAYPFALVLPRGNELDKSFWVVAWQKKKAFFLRSLKVCTLWMVCGNFWKDKIGEISTFDCFWSLHILMFFANILDPTSIFFQLFLLLRNGHTKLLIEFMKNRTSQHSTQMK